ncbi:MAG: alpha/beta hydrolase [Planctomycetes bacterium]|nr:alpha/beta hydrolase [Planctomycetota bacterium]
MKRHLPLRASFWFHLLPVLLVASPACAQTAPAGNAATAPLVREYGCVDGEKLLLDIYPPAPGSPETRAGVIVVHGGGWVDGKRSDLAASSRWLAQQGYTTFSIDYRLCNSADRFKDPSAPAKNRFPAALDDCQRAVRWIRRHAEAFGIEPQRLGAYGHSAGGHLVALLGTMETRDNSDPELASYSSRVNAVVNIAGPNDLTIPLPSCNVFGQPPDPKADRWQLGKPVHWLVEDVVGSAGAEAASPRSHVDRHSAPFLLLFGAKDFLIPEVQASSMHEALQKAGVKSKLVIFPNDNHAVGAGDSKPQFESEVLEFLRSSLLDGSIDK